MGFDITLHPVKAEELKVFFFDIVDNPRLIDERVEKLTGDKKKQEHIKQIFRRVVAQKDKIQSEKHPFGSSYAFIIAGIAGFLHPYWYSRNACISFLAQKDPHFDKYLKSLKRLAPNTFKNVEDKSDGKITENYVGGGFIENSKLKELKEDLNTNKKYKEIALKVLFPDGLRAINHAIDYAITNETGILEATDIVVPMSNTCLSDFDNLRAEFKHNDSDYKNARVIGKPSSNKVKDFFKKFTK